MANYYYEKSRIFASLSLISIAFLCAIEMLYYVNVLANSYYYSAVICLIITLTYALCELSHMIIIDFAYLNYITKNSLKISQYHHISSIVICSIILIYIQNIYLKNYDWSISYLRDYLMAVILSEPMVFMIGEWSGVAWTICVISPIIIFCAKDVLFAMTLVIIIIYGTLDSINELMLLKKSQQIKLQAGDFLCTTQCRFAYDASCICHEIE